MCKAPVDSDAAALCPTLRCAARLSCVTVTFLTLQSCGSVWEPHVPALFHNLPPFPQRPQSKSLGVIGFRWLHHERLARLPLPLLRPRTPAPDRLAGATIDKASSCLMLLKRGSTLFSPHEALAPHCRDEAAKKRQRRLE